jgi:AraC-like DNA-binding protein
MQSRLKNDIQATLFLRFCFLKSLLSSYICTPMKQLNSTLEFKNAVQLLLGTDVLIVEEQYWKVNQQVHIHSWLVNYPEQNLPSQFGKLVCANSSDELFDVSLNYLQHHFTECSTARVFAIQFDADFIAQWNLETLLAETAFNENHNGLQIVLCKHTRLLLDELQAVSHEGSFPERLLQMELSLQLLRKAVNYIGSINEVHSVPACSFLSNNTERDKVMQAREILQLEYDQTVTIRELSRRVAINECYLKKGFKAMFGKTINEFQQDLRINKAKKLLQIEGYTVSEVAHTLGYSSISHFSTAFKKATNMKPCELLK